MLSKTCVEKLTHRRGYVLRKMVAPLGFPQFRFLFTVTQWQREGDGEMITGEERGRVYEGYGRGDGDAQQNVIKHITPPLGTKPSGGYIAELGAYE